MTNKDTANHAEVKRLINRGEINEACKVLSSILNKKTEIGLLQLLNKQEETYKYLLHYLVEGFTDNSRNKMLAEISASLHFINDSILRNEILIDSSDLYYSTLRFERIRKASLQSRLKEYKDAYLMSSLANETGGDREVSLKTDQALSALFSYVWTMYGASSEEYKKLGEAVCDPDMPFGFKAQVISALMLGNLLWFDIKGFSVLLDIFEKDINPKLSARSLTAIIFLMAIHKDRISCDQNLMNRMELWNDSIVIYRQLREVIMTIIRAHDTQRISSKMQNEVIPQLMKIRPEILKNLGKMSEISDLEALEENPEWEELVNKNGLGDKLKELTEIQLEGGDVMMLAFSNLKSFPFFNSVGNWFLPFSNFHSDVLTLAGHQNNIFNELLESEGVMCDSDKYSFIFSLAAMPESQREMAYSQMEAQLNQFKEAMADRKLKSSLPEFDQEATRYVRDLYRFFKLFKKKNEFTDIFAKPFDFITIPFIGKMLTNDEILGLVGEFYFKRGYFEEALPMFLKLESGSEADHLYWEKIGFCYNASGNLEKALEWYSKAELFKPESLWLIKKLALINRMLHNYQAAAAYYEKALSMDHDNYQLLMNLGHTLVQSGNYKDALSNYYHADYLKPDINSTLRAIAWAEILSMNLEKSLEIFKRIISSGESKPQDYLNMGHAYFLDHNYKKAVEAYRKTLSFEGFEFETLKKEIEEDIPDIVKAGGNATELKLLLESMKYD